MAKELNIIHFNDVYEIGARSKEPVGGATRFSTAVKSFAALNPMLVFSGDLFNPSVLSTTTKGKHMVTVMNALKVHAAVIGNHEFDLGESVLQKHLLGCTFPWLWSNVVDKTTSGQLFGCLRVLNLDWNGVKVGLIGLTEGEWFYANPKFEQYAKYLDYVEEGNKLAKELRDGGADIVICIAHMRIDNCVNLAQKVAGIDLILAGHDHFYELRQDQAVIVSGCDFRNLTVVKGTKNGGKWSFDFKRVDVDSSFQEDPEMLSIVKTVTEEADKMLTKVIGTTGVVLDAVTSHVRTSETNLGNLLTDIMKHEMQTDIAFLNGGTIRSDDTYPPGDITIKTLLRILPYQNYIMTLKVPGKTLKQALEAAVSLYPADEGRFPQVSGIQFEFDPQQPAGSRVCWVKVNGSPLDEARVYVAATYSYIAKGNDGYDCLPSCEVGVDEENAPILSALVRRYFTAMKVLATMDASRKSDARLALEKWAGRKTTYNVQPKVEGRIIIKGVTPVA